MVRLVEHLQEFKTILKDAGDKLVVVDFTATWCPPCKRIAPVFAKLSEEPENQNVIFLKVDVDEAQDVSQECDIKCMPTFQFYKNGNKANFSGPYPHMMMIFKQLKMEGFLQNRWKEKNPESLKRLMSWLQEGKLKCREHITKAFENMPAAFMGMLQGENIAKAVTAA